MSHLPSRILPLSANVANQIAAGEVIERPASIVKELLENALDARASAITIEIGYGGLNQVKISDNGSGICADDLPLAIAAHATSKIAQLNDLYAITSLGFRGEALASIASVAKVTISSKPSTQQHGMMLQCYPEPYQLVPVARSQGTTVDVCDIFFNAPVRKKFLKSEKTEFQAIDHVVRRFALSAPTLAIQLWHNGKSCLQLPSASDNTSRLARITKVLGRQFVDQAIYLDNQHQGLRVLGWISGLHYQRSQTDKLWVYVNGRMVRDKLINHAIKQAYEGLLYPGRHPACLLYVTLNPCDVDVNVHPTKHEVRFQQARLIHDFISTQLRHALLPPPSAQQPLSTGQFTYQSALPDMQVRESYLADPKIQPHLNERPQQLTANHPWQVLNQRFALCYVQQQPYLADMLLLQQQWLIDTLSKMVKPFASRPLLVPVAIDYPTLSDEHYQVVRQFLHQVGMHIEQKGTSVVIQALPIAVPNLVIKTFLPAFLALIKPTLKQTCQLLASHQTFFMNQITDEQYQHFFNYIRETVLKPTQFSLFGDSIASGGIGRGIFLKQLSEHACQEFMNGY